MKFPFLPQIHTKKWVVAICRLAMLACLVPMLRAQAANEVGVSPTGKTVEGNMPLDITYPLFIGSPSLYPAGVTKVITLDATATNWPVGDQATAESYISFLDATTGQPVESLTFDGPNQIKQVNVQVKIPLLGLPAGVNSATFVYQITNNGWPTMTDGSSVINHVSNINAKATIDPSQDPNRLPPIVTISTPTDGQIFTPLVLPTVLTPYAVQFQFTATARAGFPIVSIDATINGSAVSVTSTPNADSTIVVGTATLPITATGTYTLVANAHNSVGDATDTNAFSVTFTAVPPVAAVLLPQGSSYTLRAGQGSVGVPFTFTITRLIDGGNVNPLVVLLDGAPATFALNTALNALVVVGSGTRTFAENELTVGTSSHTITVQGSDSHGTSNIASADFTINYLKPTPTVAITLPGGSSYQVPIGSTSVSVPFSVASTSNNGFNVDNVTVSSTGGTVSTLSHAPGLGTSASITSTGSVLNVGPGTYTVTANCASAGVTATPATTTFTVLAPLKLPSVAITAPTVWTYNVSAGAAALSIPLTFVGTSNEATAVITKLTATFDGAPLSVSGALNLKVATGTATLTVPVPATASTVTHTIAVTATDFVGTASTSQTLTVIASVVQNRTVSGHVFFDADADGTEDCAEFGLSGVTVKISNATNQAIVTNACGDYIFSGIAPGTYTVSVVAPFGFKATTPASRSITVSSGNVTVPSFGLGLDFAALRTTTANGFTIGYWKNNLDKAISGKTSGIQVPASTLLCYTRAIGDFALSPFDNISEKTASSTMGSNSSRSQDLLAKQLVASEYNYMNAAYLNGNKNLTFCFVWWGENVLKNYSSYSSTYVIWVKDWFDAYNNSHGGVVAGPN